jgi:hypothetical protein
VNIAILIGISTYVNEANLPACWHDVENMRQVLFATGKYNDIHIVRDRTDAIQVKQELRDFFSRHLVSKDDIEEAFVYFSGHGTYHDEALFCCSDFDHTRPNSTSITNAELDDLFRSVSPQVAVKVIDACQSGSPYIKEAGDGFVKSIGKSNLKAFIAMASSKQNQSSYASKSESYFTARWIDAALSKDEGTTLYRDINSALADAFSNNPEQTPFFVTQGTGLEPFAIVSEAMKQMKADRVKGLAPAKSGATLESLIGKAVAKLDSQYVAQDAADVALTRSADALQNVVIDDPVVASFYGKEIHLTFKMVDIPNVEAVAKFADEQSWGKNYFVKIHRESYQKRVPKYGFAAFALFDDSGNAYTTETRYRATSLQATQEMPFEVANIAFRSEHPSLQPFDVYVGLVHSRTDVMVVSATTKFVQTGWETRERDASDVQWRYQNLRWVEIVKDPALIWNDALARGIAEIRLYLESFTDEHDLATIPPTVDDE